MKNDPLQLLHEAVASQMWMYLDVPDDVTRHEFEEHAARLADLICRDASAAEIDRHLRLLQVQTLSRPLDLRAIATLTHRVISTVRGASMMERRALAA